MVRPDGVQQGSQVLRAGRVRGAFKLHMLVHAFGIQVGGDLQAVRNFAQGLVELLENGQLPELNQRLRREPDGVQVVVVQLDVVDAVPVLGVVVSALVPVVFNGGVVTQVRLVAHRPQVLLDGADADVFPVAPVQRFFAGQTQFLFRRERLSWVGQAPVDDPVPKKGVLVGRHVGSVQDGVGRFRGGELVHHGQTAGHVLGVVGAWQAGFGVG